MAPKVILISLDGATDAIVDKYLANGVLDSKTGLGLLKSKGVAATDNETITPSITAPAHIAIATGSTAVNNDINANSFSLVSNPFTTNTSGFAAPIGGYKYQSGIDPSESDSPTATPIWSTLRAAGKKVVAATFPGADGLNILSATTNKPILDKKEDRTVDYTVPFGTFGGVGGKGFSLTAADFSVNNQQAVTGLTALGKNSFSTVKVAKLESIAPTALTGGSTNAYDLQVAAIDTTNDNVTNYDTLVVFDANVGIKGAATLPATGSAFIKASDRKSSNFFFDGSNNKVGTAFYASNLAADLSKVNIARYSGTYIPRPAESPGVVANVDDINNNVGTWAPQADFRFPERLNTGLTNFSDAELEAIYEDQVKTFVDYQAKVLLRSIQQNPNADLVLGYIEQPDGSEHQFLLTDPRQATDFTNPNSIGAGQDAAKVARYAKYVETAYQAANSAVQKVIDAVGVDANGKPNSDIIVVSDHGFSPFHTAVDLNNLLKSAGFDSTKVRAVTSGPAVNIYINLKGRESNGTVEVAEYLTLQKKVLETIKGLVDTNANYTNGTASVGVFDKVYNREVPATATTANDVINARGAFIGEDTGDVFALLKTGYNFDGTQSTPVVRKGDLASTTPPIFSVPNFYGAHGYDPTLTDMKAIFYAAGPDIGQQQLGSVRNIDVAPTIEKILNVTPAATVNGTALSVNLPAFSGVAAGDATATSAILWTRTFDSGTKAGISTKLNLQVATDTNFTNPLTLATNTDSTRDYTTKVDVTGLKSGTQYYYRFQTPTGGSSQVGTFKTALDPTVAAPVRFGFSGDANGFWRPFPSTANFGKLGLDYFIYDGDTLYETASKGSPAAADPGTNPAQALIDYRRKYLENIQPTTPGGFSGLQTLYAAQGNYILLDNHELGNKELINGGAPAALAKLNANGSSNPADDVNTTGAFINKTAEFKNIEQAYLEYQPVREKIIYAPNDPRTDNTQQLFFAQQWGKNSIFVNVDSRTYRDVRLNKADGKDDTGARADNPNRTLLGATQLAWLKKTLLDAQTAGTPWKFVTTSDPIAPIWSIGSGDDSGKSWIGGYRAERNDLLKFIADNGIKNVVFLATDDHLLRINELTYLDNINDPTSVRVLPNAISIVDGPIGSGGPDLITDHSPANIKAISDALAAKQIANGVNPIGLDPNFPGLKNLVREGDPTANTSRQPFDFYSPDTFNYTVFDVSADGKTLKIDVQGVNSYAADTNPEPSTTVNPIRSIVSFSLDAAAIPTVAAGTSGDDSIIPTTLQTIFTDGGKDLVDGSVGGGSNRIYGGDGNDELYAGKNDRLFGEAGDDILDAVPGKGGNRLYGGDGNDTLFAGTNDFLSGGDGNDLLYAGKGGNTLYGGAGADKFYLAYNGAPTSTNTVADFEVGIDKLLILGISGVSDFSKVTLTAKGTDTLVATGGKDLALLTGIGSSSLNAGSFAFV